MLVKEEIIEKLDPLYQLEIKKLENEYTAISDNNLKAKKECLFHFSQKYLMLPELWEEYFDITKKELLNPPNSSNLIKKLFDDFNHDKKRAKNQFFIQKHENFYKKLWNQKRNSNNDFFLDYKEIISTLSLPCKNLDETWKFYDENSANPLPKETFKLYKETKELYLKILEAENCDEKWADLISTVTDKEYVENNFEWRIGKNLNNQKLWLLYFQYLEIHDIKRLLYAYSSYCRFFLNDLKTKNAYKKVSKKYGPSIVSWKNLFSFEKFKEETFEEVLLSKAVKYQPRTNVVTKISTDNCKAQIFSFPKTLILYLIENGKANIIHKLHKSCKYFFVIFPYPIYHMLRIDESHPQPINPNYIEFFQQSIRISIAWYQPISNFSFQHRFIISNSLFCASSERNTLKNIIPFIFRCDAKYLQINGQDLNLNELKVLLGQENVEKLCLFDNRIINDKDDEISLEDILQFTSKIKCFDIKSPKITEETFLKLAELKFQNKFTTFILRSIINCDPYGMAEFLKKYFDKNSKMLIYFEKNTIMDTVENTLKQLKIEYWNDCNINDMPYVEFFNHLGHSFGYFGNKPE